MKSINGITLTFVKNQFADGMVMEVMAILNTGEVVQRTFPVDGRVIRLDAEILDSPEITVVKTEDDGA